MACPRIGRRRPAAYVLAVALAAGSLAAPSLAAATAARPAATRPAATRPAATRPATTPARAAADLAFEADAVSFVSAQRAARDRVARTGRPGGRLRAARIAVRAAWSAIGAPYVSSSSNPAVGVDCSGLTVFAWRRAGVRLPHSSAEQFASFPRVPLSKVRPGDLVYYGDHGPHIAIAIGRGKIIHATSSAPGGQARVDSLYGYDRPWGAVRVA